MKVFIDPTLFNPEVFTIADADGNFLGEVTKLSEDRWVVAPMGADSHFDAKSHAHAVKLMEQYEFPRVAIKAAPVNDNQINLF